MSSNHQKKYSFSAISIKPNVATRFRKFSKRISRSHTDALETMMNFFDLNELSPNESLGANMQTLENSLKNASTLWLPLLEILKNQTKPTNAMLELLFQENPNEAAPQEEIFEFEQQELITENEELNHYRNRYEEVQQQFHSVKYDLEKSSVRPLM